MRERWFSSRAFAWHLAVVLFVPGCLIAAWWQIHVALRGDGLAYLYSVEWPVFAIFGIIFWWHVIHDDPNEVGMRGLRRRQSVATDDLDTAHIQRATQRDVAAEDDRLSAYNDYLAGLSSRNERKTWRKP